MPNTPVPLARTPLHHWHAAHGAHFAEQNGWQVVTHYAGAEAETRAARGGLGLADISSFTKLSLCGPAVPDLTQTLIPDGAAAKPGSVAVLPSAQALACRLTDRQLLVLGATGAAGLARQLAQLGAGRTLVQTDVTSAYAGFCVVGPRLEEVLRRVTQLDVRPAAFRDNSCAETALAGVEALLVRPVGFSLPALCVYVPWDLGEYVWERLIEAGQDGPMTPIGLAALRTIGAL